MTPFGFFKQNIIGLDLGSSHIKLLQLQKAGDAYVVRNGISRAIPVTLKKDNTEEKRKFLVGFIREFLSETRVKAPMGRIALYGKGVFLFFLTVPQLNKKDLQGAVAVELKKRLPFQMDVKNLYFDYFVSGQVKEEKGVNLQITCIAVDKAVAEEQVQILKDLEVTPTGVYVVPDTLGNLLAACVKVPADKTVTLLEIGANTALLNFYRGRNLIFSREIPIGGEHITHALAKTVATAAGSVAISLEDAEKIKRICGIPLVEEAKTDFMTDFGVFRGEQLLTLLRPTLERLIQEISRTMLYYSKTFKTGAIEELYLTGGTARLRNFDRFLQTNIDGIKKVENLNVLKAVKGWDEKAVLQHELAMEQAAPHLAVAFGLCLGGGARVNLLPPKERLAQRLSVVMTVARFIFPLLFVVSLVFYGSIYTNAMKYKVITINLKSNLKKLEASCAQVREYHAIKAKIEERRGLLERAKNNQPFWAGVMKELSSITPKEVTLSRITVAFGKQPMELQLSGEISSKYTLLDMALQQYIMVLDDSPYFSGAKVVSSAQNLYATVPTAGFDITCTLDY